MSCGGLYQSQAPPAPGGVRFQERSLHQALSTSVLCSGRGLRRRLSLALLAVRGDQGAGR